MELLPAMGIQEDLLPGSDCLVWRRSEDGYWNFQYYEDTGDRDGIGLDVRFAL